MRAGIAALLTLVLSNFEATAAEEAAQQPESLQTVEVSAARQADRQLETAAKVFVTREEVQKFGDKTLSDVLKRVPGVTVDREVRIRGLGSGYTQILIDGEPAPQGFTIDSIDPDMIERIEVLRAPVAELSTRTIAGTINLILRKSSRRRQRQYKFTAERTRGSWSPAMTGQMSSGDGHFSYQLAATAMQQRPVFSSAIEDFQSDSNGVQRVHRLTNERFEAKTTSINLAPQVSWKSERDTLSWQNFFQRYERPAAWELDERTLLGRPTDFPYSEWTNNRQNTGSARSDLTWTRRLDEGAKLDTKLAFNRQARDTDFHFYGFNASDALQLDRHVISDAIDNTLTSKGKYLTPIADAHAVAAGWEGSYIRRNESRLQLDSSAAGDLLYQLDQQYVAQIKQLALFAQDEWSVSRALQLYWGLRWERLQTRVSGREFEPVESASSVFSPVVQLLWSVPHRKKDQVRLGVSRTYKAPVTADLIPRRYTVNNNNSPTNADVQGNPDLRPELAWGLDLAYEAYFAGNGFAGVSAYMRDLASVTTATLFLDGTQWVMSSANNGSAKVYGMEVELKAPVRTFFKTARDIDVRANIARNFSSVQSIPGSYNRLAAQTPTSANLGVDYKPVSMISLGANYSYRSDSLARITPVLTTSRGAVSSLDLYGALRVNTKTDIQVSLTNLLHGDRDDFDVYDADGSSTFRNLRTNSATLARLTFEHRF